MRFAWLALFAVSTMQASAAEADGIPIEVHGDHAYVRVSVEQTGDLWFLLDSGAATPVNLIDAAVAARIGLKGQEEKSGGAIGGQVKVQLTAPATMKIGDRELAPAPLAMIALADAAAEEGHHVDGILGYAFFSMFNPEIDYRNSRMRLNEAPTTNASEGVEMQIVDKHVRVFAEIDLGWPVPLPVRLTVDTGFDGALVLTRPFVEKLELRSKLGDGKASGGASLGGETGGINVRIPSLRIGEAKMESVETRLSTDMQGAFARADVDGYVGGAFLRNYSVLFDYKNGRFVLRK